MHTHIAKVPALSSRLGRGSHHKYAYDLLTKVSTNKDKKEPDGT